MPALLDAAFGGAQADDGQAARRAGDDHVEFRQALRHVGQADGFGAEALSQARTALDGAVGDHHAARLVCGKVGGHQFDHVSRADEQHAAVVQAFEHGLRQMDAGGCHADRMRADFRMGANLFRHRKSALEHLVERAAQGAGIGGKAHGFLHLPKNLWLAEHHRIQSAGDAKGMAYRAVLNQPIAVIGQVVQLHIAFAGKPVQQGLARIFLRGAIDFGAVAGR
ncbi:hypothetical protein GALL_533750 [mine drainage metagenome]|uniref:Uncharacterized protein n=1 Tax=mine drainage metagenome TaxID=410659 RepID=A0A1J5PNC2_9ZZZZ